jgi:hypothetical protein
MSHVRTLLIAISLLALSAAAAAQTSTAQTPAAKPMPRDGKAANAPASAEAEALAAQRRAQAVSLLTSLADEARDFRDETVSARAQARAADALWESDAERARELFRRAWKAADSADREAARKLEEETRAQLAKHGTAVTSTPPDLRAEVLRLAARRDRALGEELLKQLAESSGQGAGDAAADATSTDATPTDALSPDAKQRLGLAQELLDGGDKERALQFADAALSRANMQAVAFLSALREKDAGEADRRYGAMLARAASDPASDANTVSLLSSYVFTPFTFFTTYRNGGTGTSASRGGVAPPDAPALRASFLRAAAQILLRPLTPQDYERTSAGRVGTYLVIRRLLPNFELYAPDMAPALNARLVILQQDVPEGARSVAERRIGAGEAFATRGPERDEVQVALERAEQEKDVSERDAVYANLVTSLAWRGDTRAQDYVEKIDDLDLRHRVRAFADFAVVRAALQKSEAEAAVERAHKGDLTHAQRAWALENAAGLLAKSDRPRALMLLEEAVAEAKHIDNDDPDRARALVAAATRYEKLDRQRAWDLMYEASKAANSAPAFTGEDGKMTLQLRTKHGAWMTDFNVREFDLTDILEAFAAEDLDRAIQLSQSFTNEAARAAAAVAVARSVLVKGR